MSLGAVLEPLVVVTLLFGGVYVNRNTNYKLFTRRGEPAWKEKAKVKDDDDYDERGTSDEYSDGEYTPTASDPMLENGTYLGSATAAEPTWRRREVGFWKFKANVVSPNTRVFKDNFLSRLLIKLPFLVECWYWALIYWVYQLGRAIGALTLVEGTVNVARRHALQVIHLEQRLGLFWEPQIQAAFMRHEALMHWINRIYSFIHIPGTIFFLVWLYNYTTVRNRLHERQDGKPPGDRAGSPGGPALYEARRRTMAVCNLLAFIVFTAWPCMPPRLLSDPKAQGPEATEGRTYGFHDTVHGAGGESSVWTQNKFCNQYAAMPSLHFGYSLMIGMTVALIPLNPRHSRGRAVTLPVVGATRLPSPRRLLCLALGFAYPFIILIAIVSTANHFILDAVAGAIVCGLGWRYNGMLLALLPVEDYFLWCLRIHKP